MKTQEGMIIVRRMEVVNATQEKVFNTFTRLGGEQGWLYFNSAWKMLGMIDRLVGGVGFRRGRRHPVEVRAGDTIDFWRVEVVEPKKLMRLRAEMKLPGNAWLQFEVKPHQKNTSQLIQTIFFAPKGLFGLMYWYGLYPMHSMIFSGLLRKIKELVEVAK
jgi:hypothetical protein